MTQSSESKQEFDLPRDFGVRGVAEWLRAAHRAARSAQLHWRVDISGRLSPSGLVLLAAHAARRRELGFETTFEAVGGASPSANRADSTSWEPWEQLRAITDLRIARQLADDLGDDLEQSIGSVGSSPIRALRFVAEELAANVVQHSSRPSTGFGAASFEPATRAIEVAFADSGVGILASLQRHPELESRLTDHGEALQVALDPRVSGGTPGRNMGLGLSLLRDLSDRTEGELWIASGSALLHRRTLVAGQRSNTVTAIDPWPGTWVALVFTLPPTE